jgi:hypothetical protein
MESIIYLSSGDVLVDILAFGFFATLPRAVSGRLAAVAAAAAAASPDDEAEIGGVKLGMTCCEPIYLGEPVVVSIVSSFYVSTNESYIWKQTTMRRPPCTRR